MYILNFDDVYICCFFQYFELKLDKFGPYSINYTRNGRYYIRKNNLGNISHQRENYSVANFETV